MKTNARAGSHREAIIFPETPEHPATINPELQYRLDWLRVLDRRLCETENEQANSAIGTTAAWMHSTNWMHEWLIKGARESIRDLGPLTDSAQRSEFDEFTRSLGENMTVAKAADLCKIGLSKPDTE